MNFVTSVFKKYIHNKDENVHQEAGNKANSLVEKSSNDTSRISDHSVSYASTSQKQLPLPTLDEDEPFQDAEPNYPPSNHGLREINENNKHSLLTSSTQDKPLGNFTETNISSSTCKDGVIQANIKPLGTTIDILNQSPNKKENLNMISQTSKLIESDSLNNSMVDSLELSTSHFPVPQELIDSIETLRYSNNTPPIESNFGDQEFEKYASLEQFATDSIENLSNIEELVNSTQDKFKSNNNINDAGHNKLIIDQKYNDEKIDTLNNRARITNKDNENIIVPNKPVSLNDILFDSSARTKRQPAQLDEAMDSRPQDNSKIENINYLLANPISEESATKSNGAVETLIRKVHQTFSVHDVQDLISSSANVDKSLLENKVPINSYVKNMPEIEQTSIVKEKQQDILVIQPESLNSAMKTETDYKKYIFDPEQHTAFANIIEEKALEAENIKRKCNEIDGNVKKLKVEDVPSELLLEDQDSEDKLKQLENDLKLKEESISKNIQNFECHSRETTAIGSKIGPKDIVTTKYNSEIEQSREKEPNHKNTITEDLEALNPKPVVIEIDKLDITNTTDQGISPININRTEINVEPDYIGEELRKKEINKNPRSDNKMKIKELNKHEEVSYKEETNLPNTCNSYLSLNKQERGDHIGEGQLDKKGISDTEKFLKQEYIHECEMRNQLKKHSEADNQPETGSFLEKLQFDNQSNNTLNEAALKTGSNQHLDILELKSIAIDANQIEPTASKADLIIIEKHLQEKVNTITGREGAEIDRNYTKIEVKADCNEELGRQDDTINLENDDQIQIDNLNRIEYEVDKTEDQNLQNIPISGLDLKKQDTHNISDGLVDQKGICDSETCLKQEYNKECEMQNNQEKLGLSDNGSEPKTDNTLEKLEVDSHDGKAPKELKLQTETKYDLKIPESKPISIETNKKQSTESKDLQVFQANHDEISQSKSILKDEKQKELLKSISIELCEQQDTAGLECLKIQFKDKGDICSKHIIAESFECLAADGGKRESDNSVQQDSNKIEIKIRDASPNETPNIPSSQMVSATLNSKESSRIEIDDNQLKKLVKQECNQEIKIQNIQLNTNLDNANLESKFQKIYICEVPHERQVLDNFTINVKEEDTSMVKVTVESKNEQVEKKKENILRVSNNSENVIKVTKEFEILENYDEDIHVDKLMTQILEKYNTDKNIVTESHLDFGNRVFGRQDTQEFENLERQCRENIEVEDILGDLIAESIANKQSEKDVTSQNSDIQIQNCKIYNRQDTREFEIMERKCQEELGEIPLVNNKIIGEYKSSGVVETPESLKKAVQREIEVNNIECIEKVVGEEPKKIYDRQDTQEFEKLERQCNEAVKNISEDIVEEIVNTNLKKNDNPERNSLAQNDMQVILEDVKEEPTGDTSNNKDTRMDTTEGQCINRQDSQEIKKIERHCSDETIINLVDNILEDLVNQSMDCNDNKDIIELKQTELEHNNTKFQIVKNIIPNTEEEQQNNKLPIERTSITNQHKSGKSYDQFNGEENVERPNYKTEVTRNLKMYPFKVEENVESNTSIVIIESLKSNVFSNSDEGVIPPSKTNIEEKLSSSSIPVDYPDSIGTDKTEDVVIINTSNIGTENYYQGKGIKINEHPSDQNILMSKEDVGEKSKPVCNYTNETELKVEKQQASGESNKGQTKETALRRSKTLETTEVSTKGVKPINKVVVHPNIRNNQCKINPTPRVTNVDTRNHETPSSKINAYNDQESSDDYRNTNDELKSKVDLLQQELDYIRKSNRRKNPSMVIPTRDADVDKDIVSKYRNLLTEYEKHIVQQASDLEKLKLESESNIRHFNNTEMAFSDLFEKYEKAKYAITAYRRNEDILLENLQKAEDALLQLEDKCLSMKEQSFEEIKKAREQVEQEKTKYKQDISRLQAQIKRLEIKASSLEIALKQKSDECQALASLCDDITGRSST